MPLSFANPALLIGALAAAVPILIHFLSRRRVRRLPFSDLRFLSEAQVSQARRLGMRRLLLLILRVLAILCVVLAMARPHVGGVASAQEGGRSLLFLVDASASMQSQEGGETRFAAALRACRELAGALPAGSEVQVLSCGARAEPLFAQWVPASGPVAETVSAIRVTDAAFDLAAALREAAGWVRRARSQPVDIILLSDLQKVPGGERQIREAGRELLEAGRSRLLIRRIGEPLENGSVRAVRLPTRAVSARETIRITADVVPDHADQVFLLEIDGRRVAEAVAAAAAGRLGRVEFALAAPGPGLHRGRVVKESDRLPVDDVRPFVLQVWDELSVLLIHGADRGVTGRGGWRYLAEALAPARTDSSLFRVRAVQSGQAAVGDLAGVDVVLVVDPDPLGRDLLGGLLAWLGEGGAAGFFLGDPTLADYLGESLLPALGFGPDLVFRSLPAEGREMLRVVDPGHPALAGFDEEALRTLADIPWRRFFVLPEGGARVVLAFTSEAPALLEARYGQGLCVLAPFSFQLGASELAVSPMFLPFAQRLCAYLARRGEAAGRDLRVGERPELRLTGSRAARGELADVGRLLVAGPDPAAAPAPATLTWRRDQPVLLGEDAHRQGFYVFTAGADTVGLLAAVTPATEMTAELWEVADLRIFLDAAGLSETVGLAGEPGTDFASLLAGREISAWLLGLACLILLLESHLARGAEARPGAA